MLEATSVTTSVLPGDVSARSIVVRNPAGQAAAQPWVDIECYQMSAGSSLGRIDVFNLGKQCLVRETQSAAVLKVGATPSDFCTVSYSTRSPQFRFSALGAGAEDVLYFLPEHTEFDILVPSGTQTTYIGFSQKAFLAGARVLDPEGWEHAPTELRMFNVAQHNLLKLVVQSYLECSQGYRSEASAPDVESMGRVLLDTAIQLLVGSTESAVPASVTERARGFSTYRKARLAIEECLDSGNVPSVVELCTAIGVSERALQYAFRTYMGMTPVEYLRLCRLSRARSQLLSANPLMTSVTDIAMQFGFFHLGRFARDYRRVFGESPSTTLNVW